MAPAADKAALLGGSGARTGIRAVDRPGRAGARRWSEAWYGADLPGVAREDIEVTLQDGVLTIYAEARRDQQISARGRVMRQERFDGSYERSLWLGNNIDTDKVSATFRDGVLQLVVPKLETRPAHQISVDIQ